MSIYDTLKKEKTETPDSQMCMGKKVQRSVSFDVICDYNESKINIEFIKVVANQAYCIC